MQLGAAPHTTGLTPGRSGDEVAEAAADFEVAVLVERGTARFTVYRRKDGLA